MPMKDLDQRERAWLWLYSAVGANARFADELIYLNDGLLPLFDSVRRGKTVRIPDSADQARQESVRKSDPDRAVDSIIAELEKAGCCAVTRDSADYPYLLREIYDPPTVLFVKGKLRGDIRLPIAVVGSRKCSDYGRGVSEYFGKELARNGACVISGMADGCDSEAAWGALSVTDAEYPTVAVLGCGPDVVYPRSNRKLYEAIAERGAVISEFGIGTNPLRENFPRRNRIISGMSKGVLVTEAAEKSGTSITVGFAHDQGRDVFAVPGRITDIMSRGANRLIKDGEAKAVFAVDDILFEYGAFVLNEAPHARDLDRLRLPEKQRRIYDELVLGEKTADALSDMLGLGISEINIYLTEMELSGIIKRLPNGEYSV